MKKIIIILISLFLLCACSSGHSSKVTDGSDAIYKAPNGKAYTKADLYEDLLSSDITSYLTNDLTQKIAKFEGIDVESIAAKAQEEADEAVKNGSESYITYYYGSVESYVKQLTAYLVSNELSKLYIESNLTRYEVDYEPFKAQIISVDDEEVANKIVKYVEEKGKELVEAAAYHGYEDEITTELYTNNSDLPLEVFEYVKNNGEGFSGIINSSTTETDADGNEVTVTTYYLVNVISKDVLEFQDEFVELVVDDIDFEEAFINYLNNYEVNIYDQKVYDLLSEKYEVLK